MAQNSRRTRRASQAEAKSLAPVEVDSAADVRQVAARTVEARDGGRSLTKTLAQPRPCLYTRVPAANVNPSDRQRLPLTVRCERELRIGSQIWVQQECWEIAERHPAPDDAPQRSAFLCATSPLPRARIHAGIHESSLYEPDLLDLAHAVRHVHGDETPTTRTIQAAIRAALDGGAELEAKLQGDALRVLAQAIRGLEISQGLSPALRELAWDLNKHFDDLLSPAHERRTPRARKSSTERA